MRQDGSSGTLIAAFTAAQVSTIAGMTVDMVNYLAREEYLVPSCRAAGRRGRTRYFSYRDLVAARVVQRLSSAGVELKRLKQSIRRMGEASTWLEDGVERSMSLIVTDGKRLYFPGSDGSLVDILAKGQLAFSFVLDIASVRQEVLSKLSSAQAEGFSMVETALLDTAGLRKAKAA